jgi:hypothetical protein
MENLSEEEEFINMPFLDMSLSFLVQERNEFEIFVYDFLVNPFQSVPESFWEPVKVSFDGVKDLDDIIGKDNCFIC